MPINKKNFKKIIILFWMIWWLVALWTDIVGILAHSGLLVKSWAKDSNFPFLVESLKMYAVPNWLPLFLFAGILLWSMLSTATFAWASISLHLSSEVWLRRADIAFIISLSYWLAFFIADQIIMNFDLEENHMVQGGFQLLSYLALYILPSEDDS
jgi:hypothetical protein